MDLIVVFVVGTAVGIVAGVMGYRRALKRNPALVERLAQEAKAWTESHGSGE